MQLETMSLYILKLYQSVHGDPPGTIADAKDFDRDSYWKLHAQKIGATSEHCEANSIHSHTIKTPPSRASNRNPRW